MISFNSLVLYYYGSAGRQNAVLPRAAKCLEPGLHVTYIVVRAYYLTGITAHVCLHSAKSNRSKAIAKS